MMLALETWLARDFGGEVDRRWEGESNVLTEETLLTQLYGTHRVLMWEGNSDASDRCIAVGRP